MTIMTVCACIGVTPGASCARITLAARTARVSASMTVVCVTVGGVSTGRTVVDEEVDVWLVLAVCCVVFGWLVLVVGW